MTLLLAIGFPAGMEGPIGYGQGSHAGISSRTAGSSDVAGLPLTASAALPSEPGKAIASSLLMAWDKDHSLSLTNQEFGQAARSFFELADTRRDKRLTLDEVLGELTRLLEPPSDPPGASGFRACAYLAESLVVRSDSDGDNEVSSDEWRRASLRSFQQWDSNDNGRIEAGELEQAVATCLR